MLDIFREAQVTNVLSSVEVLGKLYELKPGDAVIFDGDSRAPGYETMEEREKVIAYVSRLLALQQCLVFWRRLPGTLARPQGAMVRIACGVSPRAAERLEALAESYWKTVWEEPYQDFRKHRLFR